MLYGVRCQVVGSMFLSYATEAGGMIKGEINVSTGTLVHQEKFDFAVEVSLQVHSMQVRSFHLSAPF